MGTSRIGLAALMGLLVACGDPEPREVVEGGRPPAAVEPGGRHERTRDRGASAATESKPPVTRVELERWLDVLAADDHEDRAHAIALFLAAGDVAIDLLYEWLAGDSAERAYVARNLLPEFGIDALDGAVRLLSQGDEYQRRVALRMLRELGPVWSRDAQAATVAAAIFALLEDSNDDVSQAAMNALADVRPALVHCADDIVARMRTVRLPADTKLARRLIHLAALTPAEASGPYVPLLIGFFAAGGDDVQREAALALERSRPSAPTQVERLLPFLLAGPSAARERVMQILYEWGEDAAPAADALRVIIRNAERDEDLRVDALELLGRMPSQAARALPDVVALLVDADEAVREEAEDTITAWDAAVLPLLPGLVASMDGASRDERLAVLHVISNVAWWRATYEISLETFRPWLRDPDRSVRYAALEAFANWAYPDEIAASGALLPLLNDSDADVRLAAVELYVGITDEPDVGLLRSMTHDSSEAVRIEVATVLGDVATLLAGLDSDDASIRRSAAWGLRAQGDLSTETVAAAGRWFDRTKEVEERTLALETLVDIGPSDPRTIAALSDVLMPRTEDDAVILAALRAARELGPRAAHAAPAIAALLMLGERQREALRTLGAMGDAAATPHTLAMLTLVLRQDYEDASPYVLEAFEMLGTAASSAEPELRAYLARTGDVAAYATLAAVTEDRPVLVEDLLARLQEDPESRKPVLDALLRLGREGALGVLQAFDPAADSRNGVAGALMELGEAGHAAVRAAYGVDDLRASAVLLLDVLPAAEFAEHVRPALADGDSAVRRAAAVILEIQVATGVDPTPFGPALVRLVADESPAAIRVLGRICPVPAGAVRAIRAALRSTSLAIRTDAAGALFRLTGEVGAPLAVFEELLRLPYDDHWQRVGIYLVEMGPAAAPIAATLNLAMIRSSRVRDLVPAIGSLGPAGAACLPALRAALAHEIGFRHHQEPGLTLAAVEAARRLGPIARPALPELRAILEDENLAEVARFRDLEDELEAAVRAAIKAIEAIEAQ